MEDECVGSDAVRRFERAEDAPSRDALPTCASASAASLRNSSDFTVSFSSVLLFITAESVTVSPTTKNLGACSRTMSGMRVTTLALLMPNWFASETARAVARHVVSESGSFTFTVALPFASVTTSGCQNAVARKSERTTTFGSFAPPDLSSPAFPSFAASRSERFRIGDAADFSITAIAGAAVIASATIIPIAIGALAGIAPPRAMPRRAYIAWPEIVTVPPL